MPTDEAALTAPLPRADAPADYFALLRDIVARAQSEAVTAQHEGVVAYLTAALMLIDCVRPDLALDAW